MTREVTVRAVLLSWSHFLQVLGQADTQTDIACCQDVAAPKPKATDFLSYMPTDMFHFSRKSSFVNHVNCHLATGSFCSYTLSDCLPRIFRARYMLDIKWVTSWYPSKTFLEMTSCHMKILVAMYATIKPWLGDLALVLSYKRNNTPAFWIWWVTFFQGICTSQFSSLSQQYNTIQYNSIQYNIIQNWFYWQN